MRWRFHRRRLQGETPNRVDVSGGLDDDDRLAGDSSGVKVTNRVGDVFEVDGSIDAGTTAPLARWSRTRSRIV